MPKSRKPKVSTPPDTTAPVMTGLAVAILGALWLLSGGGREMVAGLGLAGLGLWMVVSRSARRLGGGMVVLVLFCAVASLACFLPERFGLAVPWRSELGQLGIGLDPSITPQAEGARHAWLLLLLTGVVFLRLLLEKPPGRALPWLVLAVVSAIVGYCLLSLGRDHWAGMVKGPEFGFFPNRNHSAGLVATGTVLAAGLLLHGLNRRRWGFIAAGAASVLFLIGINVLALSSRAGVLLMLGGLLVLGLVMASRVRTAWSRHALRALGLVVLAGGIALLVSEGGVKERLVEGSQGLFEAETPGDVQTSTVGSRWAVYRDTAAMIAAQPLAGWGAGQFVDVYPQYIEHSAQERARLCLHPENSWLWVAAEAGLPVAVGLLGLAVWLTVRGARGVRRSDHRTLGSAVLIAATLPFWHAWVDVPLHRESVLWLSALLFGWVLPRTRPPSVMAVWGWRGLGLVVAAAGILMLGGWWRTPTDRSNADFTEARRLYQADLARETPPAPGEPDPLEEALALLAGAIERRPLDSRLHGLRGMLALHFDDRDAEAERSLARQRALDPGNRRLAYLHGLAWSKIDPERTRALWEQALRSEPDPGARDELFEKMVRAAPAGPELHAFLIEGATGNRGRCEALIKFWPVAVLRENEGALRKVLEGSASTSDLVEGLDARRLRD